MNPQIQIFLTQKCVFLSCIDSEKGKKATDCIRLQFPFLECSLVLIQTFQSPTSRQNNIMTERLPLMLNYWDLNCRSSKLTNFPKLLLSSYMKWKGWGFQGALFWAALLTFSTPNAQHIPFPPSSNPHLWLGRLGVDQVFLRKDVEENKEKLGLAWVNVLCLGIL